MKLFNRKTGEVGESLALEYLLKKGFELVSRNYSTRFGEIDLIMRDKGVLVFVEVKTKKGLDFGTPEEMFTRGKYEQVKRMATMYLASQGTSLQNLENTAGCRIDMVAVVLDAQNEPVSVKHYANVTRP